MKSHQASFLLPPATSNNDLTIIKLQQATIKSSCVSTNVAINHIKDDEKVTDEKVTDKKVTDEKVRDEKVTDEKVTD